MITSTSILASAIGPRIEYAIPGRSGTPVMVSLAFAIEGNAGDDGLFHGRIFFVGNQGSGVVAIVRREGRQHAQLDFVFAGKLDRTDLQHLRSQACQFEHLLKGDLFELPRFRHYAWIGRVHAIHVSENLAFVRIQGSRQRHAVVSEPPRPKVVMLPYSSTPGIRPPRR